jgi:phage terminase Nu1 subunit (DNA packaging protein)
MRHEKLSKSELSERFGVDVRTITNWVAEGMPSRKESGRLVFAWPECYEWREQRIRADERALRHAGGSADTKLKAAELRLRQLEIEVEQADLDLAERRGQLVPVNFMAGEFDRIAQGIRKTLLSFPATWAERLGSALTTIDRQLMLQDAVNDMMPLLRELADAEADEVPGAAGASDERDDDGDPPAVGAVVA